MAVPPVTSSETGVKNREYNRLIALLSRALPEMEEQCARLSSAGGGGDAGKNNAAMEKQPNGNVSSGREPKGCGEENSFAGRGPTDTFLAPRKTEHPAAKLADARALEMEAGEMREAVESLRKYGEDLVEILAELDCQDTPKAREIQATLDEVRARYTRLVQTTGTARINLESAVALHDSASADLRTWELWATEREQAWTQSMCGTRGSLSLSRPALLEQIVECHEFGKALKSAEPAVTEVIRRCETAGISSEGLTLRLAGLKAKAVERDLRLEDFRIRLAHVHRTADALRAWISSAATQLEECRFRVSEFPGHSGGREGKDDSTGRSGSRMAGGRSNGVSTCERKTLKIDEGIAKNGGMASDSESVASSTKSARTTYPAMDFDQRVSVLDPNSATHTRTSTNISVLGSSANQLSSWGGVGAVSDYLKIQQNSGGGGRSEAADGLIWAQMVMERVCAERGGKGAELDALKKEVRELAADGLVGDRGAVRDLLADVQARWTGLMGRMGGVLSLIAMDEAMDVETYLSAALQGVDSAFKLDTDPELIVAELQAHQIRREEAYRRREAAADYLSRLEQVKLESCPSSPPLSTREGAQRAMGEAVVRLEAARNQLDALCRAYDVRLTALRDLVPLVTHILQSGEEMRARLDDLLAEVESTQICGVIGGEVVDLTQICAIGAELASVQTNGIKALKDRADDLRPLVNELVATGDELKAACFSAFDSSAVGASVGGVVAYYERVTQAVCAKQCERDALVSRACSDTSETLAGLSAAAQRVKARLDFSEQVSANPFALRQQISDSDDLEAELIQLKRSLEDTSLTLDRLKVANVGSLDESSTDKYSDVSAKLCDLHDMLSALTACQRQRSTLLGEAVGASDRFLTDFLGLSEGLRGIMDTLGGEGGVGVSLGVLRGQQQRLESLRVELTAATERMSMCLTTSAAALVTLCGASGSREVDKFTEDFEDLRDEILDGFADREAGLTLAVSRAQGFQKAYEVVSSWLPKAEERLGAMAAMATNARAVRIQIEEFKVFRVRMGGWRAEAAALAQAVAELRTAAGAAAASDPTIGQAEELGRRWSELQRAVDGREVLLKTGLIELGEVDHALEDVMGLLQQAETDLALYEERYSDPRHIDLHLRKVEALLKELSTQRGIIAALASTVDAILVRSGAPWSPLAERQLAMTSTFAEVEACARDRRDELLDRLKEVRGYVSAVGELSRWLMEFRRRELSHRSRPKGALVDSARAQYQRAKRASDELAEKAAEADALLLNGDDMLARCHDDEGRALRQRLERLRSLVDDARGRADVIASKMAAHLAVVEAFHSKLGAELDWLRGAERTVRGLRQPCRLLESVEGQLGRLRSLRAEILARDGAVKQLDQSGTRLKYFGSRQDAVYLRDYLLGVRIRWRRLAHGADAAELSLQQGLRDSKRFFTSWKALSDWLDDSELKLKKFLLCSNGGPGLVRSKQDVTELKKFEHEMATRCPQYASTRKQGAGLRDRAFGGGDRKEDREERDEISDMMSALVAKWNGLRAVLMQRSERLDESMLEAEGGQEGTVDALLNWFRKAALCLSDGQPANGDVDTVISLLEQHRNLEQELVRRSELVDRIRSISELTNPDSTTSEIGLTRGGKKLAELYTALDRVQSLSDTRRTQLQNSLRLAEEFVDALESVDEWLPLAESKLKFGPVPEDEDRLVRLVENHDNFHSELLREEAGLARVRALAAEILTAPHPSAARSLAHRISSLNARWVGVLQKSVSRGERLSAALHKTRCSESAQEELGAWLGAAQRRLGAEEGAPIQGDAGVVDAMASEHAKFHEELCRRLKDIDRLRRPSNLSPLTLPSCLSTPSCFPPGLPPAGPTIHRPPAAASVMSVLAGGCGGGRPDSVGCQILVLRGRWQTVWQMSSAKKRRLREAVERLAHAVQEDRDQETSPPESIVSSSGEGSRSSTATGDCFDYDSWRHRFAAWFKARKLRITDLVPPGNSTGHQAPLPPESGKRRTAAGNLAGGKVSGGGGKVPLAASGLVDGADDGGQGGGGMSVGGGGGMSKSTNEDGAGVFEGGASAGMVGGAIGAALMTRKQFVEGLLAAKCPFSADELTAAFDALDSAQSGAVNQRDFFRTILSDQQGVRRPDLLAVLSDSELIADELRQQLLRCTCTTQFPIQRAEPGKYRFGDKGKLCLVRFVNSSVTVRVGGGWMTIHEFLDSVDPCRVRSRPNSVRGGQFTPPTPPAGGQITPPRGGQMTPPRGGRSTPPDPRGRRSAGGGYLTPPERGAPRFPRNPHISQVTSPGHSHYPSIPSKLTSPCGSECSIPVGAGGTSTPLGGNSTPGEGDSGVSSPTTGRHPPPPIAKPHPSAPSAITPIATRPKGLAVPRGGPLGAGSPLTPRGGVVGAPKPRNSVPGGLTPDSATPRSAIRSQGPAGAGGLSGGLRTNSQTESQKSSKK